MPVLRNAPKPPCLAIRRGSRILKAAAGGGGGGGVAFDAVGPAGGGGTSSLTSPYTWAHVNSAAGNALLVGATTEQGTTQQVTAVTYGGVALSRLGTFALSGNSGVGGIELWGVVGGLPTGSNTVSVTESNDGVNRMTAGSMSFTGVTAFGTPVKAVSSGSVASQSVSVTATAGNMIAAVACEGGGGTWAALSGGALRYSVNGDTNTAADNSGGATWAAAGGAQSVGLSAATDFWAIIAVELQGGAAPAAIPDLVMAPMTGA